MRTIRPISALAMLALAAGSFIAAAPAGATSPDCRMLRDYVNQGGDFTLKVYPKRKTRTFTRANQPGYVLTHQCLKNGDRIAALYVPQADGSKVKHRLKDKVVGMAVVRLPYGGFQAAYLIDDGTPSTPATTYGLEIVSYAYNGDELAHSAPIRVHKSAITGMKVTTSFAGTCGQFSTKTNVRQGHEVHADIEVKLKDGCTEPTP